jgi:twitching motility protein PilT
LPAIEGGLVAAFEVMILNPSLRNLIRENKLHQVYGMMQTGQDKTGMITMNQSLLKLILARKIEIRTAFLNSSDPEELDKMMKSAGV